MLRDVAFSVRAGAGAESKRVRSCCGARVCGGHERERREAAHRAGNRNSQTEALGTRGDAPRFIKVQSKSKRNDVDEMVVWQGSKNRNAGLCEHSTRKRKSGRKDN